MLRNYLGRLPEKIILCGRPHSHIERANPPTINRDGHALMPLMYQRGKTCSHVDCVATIRNGRFSVRDINDDFSDMIAAGKAAVGVAVICEWIHAVDDGMNFVLRHCCKQSLKVLPRTNGRPGHMQ